MYIDHFLDYYDSTQLKLEHTQYSLRLHPDDECFLISLTTLLNCLKSSVEVIWRCRPLARRLTLIVRISGMCWIILSCSELQC